MTGVERERVRVEKGRKRERWEKKKSKEIGRNDSYRILSL